MSVVVAAVAVAAMSVSAAVKVHDDALLRVYLPKKDVTNATVVVVCPGLDAKGALNARAEGEDVAQAFLRREVAAAVLKYRVADDKKSVSLDDAKSALRLLQSKSGEWGIDPARIGVLGFGAGGAVAAELSVKGADDARVAFTGLVSPTAAVTDGIDEKTSGAFVAHSTRDTVAPVEVSRKYVAALRRANRPVRYQELETDGRCPGCLDNFCEWLTQSGWSPKDLGWRSPMSRVIRSAPLAPVSVVKNADGGLLVDFGFHGFGWVEIEDSAAGDYEFVWGELAKDGKVLRQQRGTCLRWARTVGKLGGKGGAFRVPYSTGKDAGAYYGPAAAKTQGEGWFGTVMPFRYLEIVKSPYANVEKNVRAVHVHYPFDMTEERFECDAPALVKVHDFCKYSILATSFAGFFLDGDRSWLKMMAMGATITTELWEQTDRQFGIDLNHAWSTAPLNIINRYVLGVKPLEAGYGKVEVKPNFGPLKRVSAQVPTPKGCITIDWRDGKLTVKKPAEMK